VQGENFMLNLSRGVGRPCRIMGLGRRMGELNLTENHKKETWDQGTLVEGT